VDPGRIIGVYGGTMLSESGTFVNRRLTDVVGAYNATASVPLADTARWTPSEHYSYRLLPTQAVAGVVHAKAGAGKLASELP
jgi:pectate lyase